MTTVVALDKINIGVVDSKINEDENENCDSNDVLVAHEIRGDDHRMCDSPVHNFWMRCSGLKINGR